MSEEVDLLVCGAGPAGCVVAERAARVLGWRVLVVDRRDHIAGNCYDERHANGVLIHRHGPHYFRTRDRGVVRYLSCFTDWIPARYEVRSLARGRLFPFPINLTTLEQFFGTTLDADSARALLASKSERRPHRTSEDVVVGQVGRELYEAFYRPYTVKQWGVDPSRLSAEVCGRIPIRFDRDGRYVDAPFQMMPRDGFTAMFRRMLRHRRIRVLLGCDYRQVRVHARVTVYCGPVDEYFGHSIGRLPYRSLQFDLVPVEREFVQPCVQINYPSPDVPFTRSVEIKHVTGQKHPATVLSFETPAASGEPYYPVPAPQNKALYERYRVLADDETRRRGVYFCGRLAQYRYFNTDEVIREALSCFRRIQQRYAPERSPSSGVVTP
jgi:UDP-galactopyranose mutase